MDKLLDLRKPMLMLVNMSAVLAKSAVQQWRLRWAMSSSAGIAMKSGLRLGSRVRWALSTGRALARAQQLPCELDTQKWDLELEEEAMLRSHLLLDGINTELLKCQFWRWQWR